MTVPTIALNEDSPAGNTDIALGDNRIREYKTQNREIMEVDHDYPSAGSTATAGQHKKVTLQEQADLGTGDTGKTFIGGQTVSGKPELIYTNEDDVDIQLTSGSKVGAAGQPAVFSDVTCTSLTMHGITNSSSPVVPIGAILPWLKSLSGTVSLPANFVECNGQTISDVDSVYNNVAIPDLNTTNRFLRGASTSGSTGGAETVTLTTAELPAHTHPLTMYNANGGGSAGIQESSASGGSGGQVTGSAGSGGAFSILPKYYTVCWILRIK